MIIKTCGLRAPANIAELTPLPIDWFGFIYYPKSSRYVGEEMEALRAALLTARGQQERVGVFVNASKRDILAAVEELGITILQLHGEESPAFCKELGDYLQEKLGVALPLMKAFRVGEDFDFSQTKAYATYCTYFLFDTKGKTHGGTGHKFDWHMLANYEGETPFLLSGGIGPEDVEAVLTFRHPRMIGVDINSKFETEPAQKDYGKLAHFVTQIRRPAQVL